MNPSDVHNITRGEIEHVLKCLRFIDRAREALEAKGVGHERIVDELRKSTDGIYGIVKDLPRID
jgi:hypothetical protein